MPAIALAVATIQRRWPRLSVAMIALLAVGVPGNIADFIDYRLDRQATDDAFGIRQHLLADARDPLAKQLPRSFQPEPGLAEEVTIGWLLDSSRSGRIPSPTGVPPKQQATTTLELALQASPNARPRSCRILVGPTELVLQKGDSLAARTGAISIVYLPTDGARSSRRQLASSTSVTAMAGPLRLVVSPGKGSEQGAALCT
jgi:hypothetical protein